MNITQDVIIDLLPAYFSGEASAATCALVEEYFKAHPDFEKEARATGTTLESLSPALSSRHDEEEKIALERTRRLMQTRASFFWLALLYSFIPFIFTIRDHKIVWLTFERSRVVGILFLVLAVFFWAGYLFLRRMREPMKKRNVFLFIAVLYTALLALFKIEDHRVVWIMFSPSVIPGFVFLDVALAMWVGYFVLRYKEKKKDL
jgi:hypothetical protein